MIPKKGQILTIAGIIVWHGKAYIPVKAQFESGLYVDIEPVYITEINIEEITKALKAVRDAGHKQLPDPKTREEFLSRKDPILEATHARSWKQLAKTGISYSIGWTDKHVRIEMSRLDKKSRWEYDPEKTKILPPDTPLEHIVESILKDVRTRPEIFNYP